MYWLGLYYEKRRCALVFQCLHTNPMYLSIYLCQVHVKAENSPGWTSSIFQSFERRNQRKRQEKRTHPDGNAQTILRTWLVIDTYTRSVSPTTVLPKISAEFGTLREFDLLCTPFQCICFGGVYLFPSLYLSFFFPPFFLSYLILRFLYSRVETVSRVVSQMLWDRINVLFLKVRYHTSLAMRHASLLWGICIYCSLGRGYSPHSFFFFYFLFRFLLRGEDRALPFYFFFLPILRGEWFAPSIALLCTGYLALDLRNQNPYLECD